MDVLTRVYVFLLPELIRRRFTRKVVRQKTKTAPVDKSALFNDFWEHYREATRKKPSGRIRGRRLRFFN
jgi:hypothetical protein